MKVNLNDLEYEKTLRYAYIDLLNYLDNKYKHAKNKTEQRALNTITDKVITTMEKYFVIQ